MARGLAGVQLFNSDDHSGLQKARMAVFGGVPWQRCQGHLQRNAQDCVPRQALKREVAAEIHAIFNAASRHDAERLLAQAVQEYSPKASALADWMEKNIPEGVTIFDFPSEHHRRIRTTNCLERLNREIRRRSRVAVLFPNEASCLRLVSAIVMETSEEWQTNRTYIRLVNV